VRWELVISDSAVIVPVVFLLYEAKIQSCYGAIYLFVGLGFGG
jgi:hypothetical protein